YPSLLLRRHTWSATLFPYTTLFRSDGPQPGAGEHGADREAVVARGARRARHAEPDPREQGERDEREEAERPAPSERGTEHGARGDAERERERPAGHGDRHRTPDALGGHDAPHVPGQERPREPGDETRAEPCDERQRERRRHGRHGVRDDEPRDRHEEQRAAVPPRRGARERDRGDDRADRERGDGLPGRAGPDAEVGGH